MIQPGAIKCVVSVDTVTNKQHADNVAGERCVGVISSLKVRTKRFIHKDTVPCRGPKKRKHRNIDL